MKDPDLYGKSMVTNPPASLAWCWDKITKIKKKCPELYTKLIFGYTTPLTKVRLRGQFMKNIHDRNSVECP